MAQNHDRTAPKAEHYDDTYNSRISPLKSDEIIACGEPPVSSLQQELEPGTNPEGDLRKNIFERCVPNNHTPRVSGDMGDYDGDNTVKWSSGEEGLSRKRKGGRIRGDGPSKRTTRDDIKLANNAETSRKLACPYFKYNPSKYQTERTCSGPGWSSVARLKYACP